jgi:hypothetical protein
MGEQAQGCPRFQRQRELSDKISKNRTIAEENNRRRKAMPVDRWRPGRFRDM